MELKKEKNRWFVIINPVAGRCKGREDWPEISKLLKEEAIEFDYAVTEKKFHATELAVRAINNNYSKIIVVGGDGTLHEVVNGIFIQQKVATQEVTIAVIAVGTGNDWIRMHNIPRRYKDAIKAISNGNTILQDASRVDYIESLVHQTRYMANVAGVGFDGSVNRKYTDLKERGFYNKWLYIFALIMGVFQYKSLKFKIYTDNKKIIEQKIFTAAIGIGKYNGGGMLQTPHAIADDGLIDITVIKKMYNISVLCHIRKLYNGNIYSVPGSMFYRASKVEIISTPPTPLEVDGEALGCSPVTFTIVPKALKVIANL